MNAEVIKMPTPPLMSEVVVETKKGVVIGAKFAGKHHFIDSQNGIYWEVMPSIIGDDELLQRSLIKWAKKKKENEQRKATQD
jgi:hypothetical protein